MAICVVRGCTKDASERFEWRTPVLYEYLVCAEHYFDLDTLEAVFMESGNELVMSSEAIPELLDFSVSTGIGNATIVHLKLGHNNVTTQERDILLSRRLADELSAWTRSRPSTPET